MDEDGSKEECNCPLCKILRDGTTLEKLDALYERREVLTAAMEVMTHNDASVMRIECQGVSFSISKKPGHGAALYALMLPYFSETIGRTIRAIDAEVTRLGGTIKHHPKPSVADIGMA
jgi:hypothetical protein